MARNRHAPGWGLHIRLTRRNRPFRMRAAGWGLTINRKKGK